MSIGVNGFSGIQDKFINSLVRNPADAEKAKKEHGEIKDTYEHTEGSAAFPATYDKKLSMVHNTAKAEDDPTANLSEGAKKVLDELKEKFGGNTDFFVGNFSSDEEASQILSATEKEFGVLLTAEELEKMASDEEYKDKIVGVIEEGQGKINEFRESLSEEELSSVKSVGFSVADDGTLKFFAELEKQSEQHTERIEKAREERKEEEEKLKEAQDEKIDEEEGKFPMVRRFVKADSLEELAEVLRDFLEAKDENKPESIDLQA